MHNEIKQRVKVCPLNLLTSILKEKKFEKICKQIFKPAISNSAHFKWQFSLSYLLRAKLHREESKLRSNSP